MNNNLIDNRQIRVFISSTFSDMQKEREYLLRHIFPKLRNLAFKHNVTLTEIDLRWGITEDESKNGKVVELCLNEIDNCIPFFIGIIGHRYGWIPEKTNISESDNMKDRYHWVYEDIESKMSVTEMEMQYGVIRRQEKTNAFFYIKDSEPNYDEIDFPEKIEKFRETILNNGRYPVSHYQSLEELGEAVEKDFQQLLNDLFPIGQSKTHDNERRIQNANIRQLCQCYIANEDYFKALDSFLINPNSRYLTVFGPSGIGKSSLLANWIMEKETSDNIRYWLYYFTNGVDEISPEYILRYWINELHRLQGIETSDLSSISEEEKLKQLLGNCILNSKKQVVIVLDNASIFQESDNWKTNTMSWIPYMNYNSKLIVLSSISNSCFTAHRLEKEHTKEDKLEVLPFTKNEIQEVTKKYLKKLYGKKLKDNQVLKISEKEITSNGRILITLLDSLVYYGNFESLEKHLSSFLTSWTANNFYERYLFLWEQEIGAELIENTLMLITVSTYGLTETELRDCLEINPLAWSQIYCIFAKHFVFQKGCIRIANTDVQDAIIHKYAKKEDEHRNKLIQFIERSLTVAEGRQKERFWDELSTQYWTMASRHEYEELMAEKLYLLISQRKVFEYLYNKRASQMVAFNGEGKLIYQYWSWLYSIDPQKYTLLTYIEGGKYSETDILSHVYDLVDVAIHAHDLCAVVLLVTKTLQLYRKSVSITEQEKQILNDQLSFLSVSAYEWNLNYIHDILEQDILKGTLFIKEPTAEKIVTLFAQAKASKNDSKTLYLYSQALELLSQIHSEPCIDKATINYELSCTYSNMQEYEKAFRHIDSALDIAEAITDGYDDDNECYIAYLLGVKTLLLKSAGQYEKALETCTLTIRRYDLIEDLRFERGNYDTTDYEVMYWGDVYSGIYDLIYNNRKSETNETTGSEGDGQAFYELALKYLDDEKEQDNDLGISWLRKAAENNYAPAYIEVAWLYLHKEKYEEALSWAEKSAKAFPFNPFCLDTLATIYQDIGKYNDALILFEKSLRLHKKHINSEENVIRDENVIAELKELIHTSADS